MSCCNALQLLELSVQAMSLLWQDIWTIVASISASSNRALEDMTLVLRERQRLDAKNV
ncbi:uncharacterized protein PHACADRAFT_258948 [Phanerochaete carnosa HHB-10118-sp]|uniref:Uncharacterized protein n=1 Tax=Phanerochaete carnosa (strain HHB-10118-sp) TaxID=650164 RepID=K5VTL9_PHACS|nr:uncharacterized protein PHACADRAFT_258948 [Phanerochaete carnosa HHB-10118-sp]EKM54823.1 hypothetical protein PHACADRAFT_258948 [Phanerochaete carnosa HHB-10118-sp]